jgi:hypothetical protein
MKRWHRAAIYTALGAVALTAILWKPSGNIKSNAPEPSPGVARIGPAHLYPAISLTPGMVATESFADLIARYTQNCPNGKTSCSYSQSHRNTTAAEKAQVLDEYPNCPAAREIDHVVPLAIGGADDVKNLWCQPEANTWDGEDFGYHTKDQLEAFLARKVKAAAITPRDAQSCILDDWVACYQKYFGAPSLGLLDDEMTGPVQDPDDDDD